jgi:ABC-2 type transport system ATP-binding protein
VAATAIQVADLHKTYGDVEAVKGISFEVAEGECLAMLGPNGAGKTTTVEILEGFRPRSSGEVQVLGMDPESAGRDFRERIGIVLQSSGLDGNLTVRELVYFYRGYYPHPRGVDEVIELVGLAEKRDTRVKALSGGQRRRLDLALGIVGDPDLIFLDEPTTGFDPSARRRSWELVDSLRSLGKTILLTTHYMDEAQNLAGGMIVAQGSPQSLGGRDVAEAVISFRLPAGASIADLPQGLPSQPRLEDNHVLLSTATPTRALNMLTTWAIGRGEELEALTVTRPSLEDIYLQLTGDDHAATVKEAVNG